MPRKAIQFQVQADMPTWVWYLIAGLAALLLVLAIIVVLLLCLRRRRKKKKAQASVPSFYDDQIPHSHSPNKFKSESNLSNHVPAHIPAPPPVAPHPPPLVGGYGQGGAFRPPSTQSLVQAAPIQPMPLVPMTVASPAIIAPTTGGNVLMQHVGHQPGRRASHGMRTVKADVIDNDGYVLNNNRAASPVIIASAPMLPVAAVPLVTSAAQKAHIEQTDTWSNPAYQIPPAADPIPLPPPPAVIPLPPAPTEPIRHNHRRHSTSHSYRSRRSSTPPPPPPQPEPKKRMTAAERLDMEDGVMDGKHFGKKIISTRTQHKSHNHREHRAPPPPPPPPQPHPGDETTEFETTDAEPIRREIINYVPPTRVETEVHLPARVVEVPVYEESPPQYVVVRERMTESQYQQMLLSQGGMDGTMMQSGHAGHAGTVYTNSSASPRMLQGVMPASVLPTFIA